MTIEFFVHGIPKPQGSKKALPRRGRRGGVVLVESAGDALKLWRRDVYFMALQHRDEVIQGPVAAELTFYLPRPQADYRSGKFAGELKDSAPKYPIKYPDLDKLQRAAFDGLADAKLYENDSQVVDVHARKLYCPDCRPGCFFKIWQICD